MHPFFQENHPELGSSRGRRWIKHAGRFDHVFTLAAWLVAISLGALLPDTSLGEQLPTQKWTFSEATTGKQLGHEMVDGNPNTAWSSQVPVTPGTGIEIDLGQEAIIQRLFFTPGKNPGGTPTSLKVVLDGRAVAVGAPTTLNITLTKGKRDADVFFDPVIARRIRIEATATVDQPWSIAELEVYGSYDPAAFHPVDAVYVDASTETPARRAPLFRAAEELRYYIGELTSRPLPVIEPDHIGEYPGTLYHIADLKPLASTWEQMQASQESGKIPAAPVNVERDGREVLFKAWPYANVRASVWAFLEKQGVRWLYPDDHGDSVPVGKGLNLECLPLRYTPAATRRYANFDLPQKSATETNDPAYLFWWRNGYDTTWSDAQWKALGGREMPADPTRMVPWDKNRKEEYKEGFEGYPHNFDNVVPNRILNQHPDWWGEVNGKRVAPAHGGPTVCLTSPGLIQFVVDKAISVTKPDSTDTLKLLPMDATSFCDCERCRKLYEPLVKSAVVHSGIRPFVASDAYCYFVSEVARGIREARPKVRILALAYADLLDPPRKIDKMPDNVTVEISHVGAPELPMSDPLNAPMRACTEEWHRKCTRLQQYEYVLLNESKTSTSMPVPLVSAMVDRERYFRSIGQLDCGTQADAQSIPYSPWNHYAYPRLLWNPDRTADEVLNEFFDGYFREAKAPMLAYYHALEDHLISHHVTLRPPQEDWSGVWNFGVRPGSFPYGLLVQMRNHLEAAEKQATNWIVSERVARIREGFDWVLKESGFTNADLDNPSVFPAVPADGTPATVGLAKIRFQKDLASLRYLKHYVRTDGRYPGVMFGGYGIIGADLRFQSPGEYTVTVTAKGTHYQDMDPIMYVYVDHQRIGKVSVNPEGYMDYTFPVSISEPGVGRIFVSFWNPGSPGESRPLYVKEIQVAHQQPSKSQSQ